MLSYDSVKEEDYPLYPEIEPYDHGYLKVSSIHTLYYEQAGNPDGIPVVFLHGGPGSGCRPFNRQFFDPSLYRIILFDQRGSGRSTPHAEIEENTTQLLVSDIEVLREKMSISRWIVFGGSWGSTLALAYAETHPESVKALILRGIFLCRREEILWFYQDGANQIYPDAFHDYQQVIPEEDRHDMVSAYHKKLTSQDPKVQLEAAVAWTKWEARTSFLIQQESVIENMTQDNFALAFARIECHYFYNNSFLRKNQLIEDLHKIKHIPTAIVQGRYDVVCPMKSAWDIHLAFPSADLYVVPDAGHAVMEKGIRARLIEVTRRFATING